MEESEDFQGKVLEIARKNWLILTLLLCGIIFVGIGILQMTASKTASVSFERGTDVAGVSTASGSMGGQGGTGRMGGGKIKVDVEGQVVAPGVYSLTGDARVQDALIAAGGYTNGANRNSVNLAQKLIDGQKVYVPAVGEAVSQSTGSTEGTVSTGGNTNGLISINSGTESELESLPGIGPVTAGKIISSRPYSSLEELTSKKAVGQATFSKIKDLISL